MALGTQPQSGSKLQPLSDLIPQDEGDITKALGLPGTIPGNVETPAELVAKVIQAALIAASAEQEPSIEIQDCDLTCETVQTLEKMADVCEEIESLRQELSQNNEYDHLEMVLHSMLQNAKQHIEALSIRNTNATNYLQDFMQEVEMPLAEVMKALAIMSGDQQATDENRTKLLAYGYEATDLYTQLKKLEEDIQTQPKETLKTTIRQFQTTQAQSIKNGQTYSIVNSATTEALDKAVKAFDTEDNDALKDLESSITHQKKAIEPQVELYTHQIEEALGTINAEIRAFANAKKTTENEQLIKLKNAIFTYVKACRFAALEFMDPETENKVIGLLKAIYIHHKEIPLQRKMRHLRLIIRKILKPEKIAESIRNQILG